MPRIQYVGYPSVYYGKHLFKILLNLRDLGVGRVVTRGRFERYPEPTFYVIRKVKPAMDDENIWGKVWVDEYFRGMTGPQCTLLEQSHLPDFRLVRKCDEKGLFDQLRKKDLKVLPREMEFRPMLKMLVERSRRARGLTDVPKLPMAYKEQRLLTRRIAEEGETPDFDAGSNEPLIYDRFRRGVQY